MDENLVWLTQKTEESKCNKTNLTFSPHTQWTQLNCKVIKKRQPPHFYIKPPPPIFELFPISSKFFGTHPKWLNFWKVLPPFNKRGAPTMNIFIKLVLLFLLLSCFFALINQCALCAAAWWLHTLELGKEPIT